MANSVFALDTRYNPASEHPYLKHGALLFPPPQGQPSPSIVCKVVYGGGTELLELLELVVVVMLHTTDLNRAVPLSAAIKVVVVIQHTTERNRALAKLTILRGRHLGLLEPDASGKAEQRLLPWGRCRPRWRWR